MFRKSLIVASVFGLACAARAQAVEVVYRQGLNGYTGTQDTWLRQARPSINLGADDIGATGTFGNLPLTDEHALIRFTGLGIPAGQQIISATLNVDTRDGGVSGIPQDVAVYGLLKDFSEGTRGNENPGFSGDGAHEGGTSTWSHQYWSPLRGDFNLDEQVTNTDIQAMLNALVDLNAFKTALVAPPPAQPSHDNLSDADVLGVGDYSGNGSVGNEDIQGLLDQLVGGPVSVNSLRVPWETPGAIGPSDRNAVADDIVTITVSADIFFNVTASFTSQYNAGVEYGWLLEDPNPLEFDNWVAFGSSEAGLSSRRPTLTVVYEPMAGAQSIPEPSTLILLAVGGLGWMLCRARFRCSRPAAR